MLEWQANSTAMVAPFLLLFEVTNALHRRVRSGELNVEAALLSLSDLFSAGIRIQHAPQIHGRALEIANLLDLGAAYDAHYLGLAELLNCQLWTADGRFYRAASQQSDRVRLLGHSRYDS